MDCQKQIVRHSETAYGFLERQLFDDAAYGRREIGRECYKWPIDG